MSATPRSIRILDTTLANQIAAGEVIERPASVLKELLENSLDAGASRIRVAIEQGGIGLIEVHDNGTGIAAAQLKLALQRHATSKIGSLAELEAIHSLGFRGEALPSIASVARLSLESRPAGEASGWRLRCEGGVLNGTPEPLAHPFGTTVRVRDLFYNTPARRKFLRTRRTEMQHIESLFKRLALIAFESRLELLHDGRTLLRLPAALDPAARHRRVQRILGKAFSDQALQVHQSSGDLCLSGWLGTPETARDRNDRQFLYINDRAVNDSVCRHAVRLAYDERLPAGRHPAWVLYLQLNPRLVDVNVHPAKQQVRFHEARMVHDFIRSAVCGVLAPQTSLTAAAGPAAYPFRGQSRGAGAWPLAQEPPLPAAAREAAGPPSRQPPVTGPQDALHGLQLFDQRWWLGRGGEKFYVADIQVVAEQLCQGALEHLLTIGQPQSRPLLLPAGLSLNDRQSLKLEAAIAALARLGVELRGSGPGRCLLLAVPLALARIPGQALADCIGQGLATLDQSADARSWILLLGHCAGQHPNADLKQAGQMLEHLMQVHERPPTGAWRELQGADLRRWLLGPG